MIKKLASILFALVLLCGGRADAWYADTGGQLQGFNVGGSPPPTLTFLQCQTTPSTSATAVMTAAAQNVGTASATRATIVGILLEDGGTVHDVSSVTVGGDSAAEVVDEGGTNATNSAIYILSNPVGTSEDVVVTASEVITQGMIVCLWSVTDLSSLTPVSVNDAADASAANPISINLASTSAGGVAVGVCANQDGTSRTMTWAGLSERADTDVGQFNISAADTSPTNGSSLSISCTWSGGTVQHSGASAAFR